MTYRLPKQEGKSGTETQSGDGTTERFTIPHGLGSTPSTINVVAKSEDASADMWFNSGSQNIVVRYAAAPPSGSNNLVWQWEVQY